MPRGGQVAAFNAARRRVVEERIAAQAKPCCACGLELPFSSYGLNATRKDGREPRCRECVKAYHAIRRKQRDPEAVREKTRRDEATRAARREALAATAHSDAIDAARYRPVTTLVTDPCPCCSGTGQHDYACPARRRQMAVV
jgi:hypothetical protein